MSWILPFPDSAITGHYGTLSAYRKAKGMQPHSGTDWAQKTGTLIPAIADGKVELIQWSNILGWVVVQSAKDNKGKTWFIGYCHLTCSQHGDKCKGDHASPLKTIKLGDSVTVGQKYLRMGNTGRATTGSHLHATASKTVKGVFGVTSAKVDLYKLIEANQAKKSATVSPNDTNAAKKKPVKPSQPIVSDNLTIVYACPHCKKELK